MKKRKWYCKNGTRFETFSVLYEDNSFILVQNDDTKEFSFGPRSDFGSLYGFPVNQSCLADKEAINRLRDWIKIDTGFSLINIGRWEAMIEAIENITK